MFEIRIKGFKTKDQAEAFYDWYEEQGEQDACIWFEYRKDNGLLDVDSMPVDINKAVTWENNRFIFEVKPQ